VLPRLPETFSFALCMTSRFSIPLLVTLTAGLLPAQEPEKSPVSFKPLNGYQPLWERSMFTTHETKSEVTVVENADWAANLQLAGWSELDGRLSVYIYRTDTDQTFILQQDEPAEAGVMQFIEVENADSLLEARVLVDLNGQQAWISQQTDSVEPPPETPIQQPAQQTAGGVQAPTTVDSRAANLRSGVILSASNTFESSLAKPGQPATATGASEADASNEASQSKAQVLMRLRERHEHLHRMFPRQGN